MNYPCEDRVTIEARQTKGKIEFSPVATIFNHDGTKIRFLLLNEDQDRRWFSDFTEANRIAGRYENGLGDDGRAARWNDLTGEWDVIEIASSARRSYAREDFHADG
jgi:hypothetical protein